MDEIKKENKFVDKIKKLKFITKIKFVEKVLSQYLYHILQIIHQLTSCT